MSAGRTLAIIAVAAICTFATRVAPFLLFSGKKPIPPIVRYLGQALPPAVIWKRNNLLSIGVGTVLYMFLVQTVFV